MRHEKKKKNTTPNEEKKKNRNRHIKELDNRISRQEY